MYNEKILNQLDNLKYLGAIKGSNITSVSKPNEFGDTVKFYAQINKEDVIQKISYRASGCTHFLVFANYFCSLVEGKTVKAALAVKPEKLESFVELDESKKHIIKIILDGFALLVRKYRKGIEKGKIEPCEVEEKIVDAPKSRPMTPKAFSKVVGEIAKNIELAKEKKHDGSAQVSKNDKVVDAKDTKKSNSSTEIKEPTIKSRNKKIEDIEVVEEKPKKVKSPKNSEKTPVKEEKTAENKNDEVIVEEVIQEKPTKRTKKATSKKTNESVVSKTSDLDKDELLENLVDNGIFLDDVLNTSNNNNVEDNSSTNLVAVHKEEVTVEHSTNEDNTTKKITIKKEKSIHLVTDNEPTIQNLNEEIVDIIDNVLESDSNNIETSNIEEVKVIEAPVEIIVKEEKPKKVETKEKTKKINKTTKSTTPTQKPGNKEEKSTQQNNNLLALKSMLSNRNNTTKKSEDNTSKTNSPDKKPDNKMSSLSAMLSKMNSKEQPKKVEDNNAKKNNNLNSLKLSLASMKTSGENNNSNSSKIDNNGKSKKVETSKKDKPVKQEKVKAEKPKKEKVEKLSKKAEEKKKTEKKPSKKVEKKAEKVETPKKQKKNDYDMEYEPIDNTARRGIFSWLRKK